LPGNRINFTSDLMVDAEKQFPALAVFLRVLTLLALAVSTTFIMLSMYTTVAERTREVGILKSLGASRRLIVSLIEQEALVLSVLGFASGVLLSFAAGYVIQRCFDLIFDFGLGWTAISAATVLVAGALGGLYPALRASRMDAVAALAYEI
jgi:putative ABC transport system permease protein